MLLYLHLKRSHHLKNWPSMLKSLPQKGGHLLAAVSSKKILFAVILYDQK